MQHDIYHPQYPFFFYIKLIKLKASGKKLYVTLMNW